MNEAPASPRIETCADVAAQMDAACGLIAGALRAGGSLAVSGGKSPVLLFERLARAEIDWAKVTVTLVDERWVPPSSPDSNEALVRAHLLTGAAAAARFIPLWKDGSTPEEAARAAEAAITPLLPFRAVVLGMGEDGHFASLFPGNWALKAGVDLAAPRLALAAPAGTPAPPQPRISLTLRALSQADQIILLASGAAKRAVLDAALGGEDLPIRAVLAQDRAPVHILWSP